MEAPPYSLPFPMSWGIHVPCDPALAIPKVEVEQEVERNQSSQVIAWIGSAQRNKFFML